MNKELYEKLGIDINQDAKSLLEAVEEKQMEYLQRAETASDPDRKQELELLVSKMDTEIDELKKRAKAEKQANKVEELKQAEAKRQEEKKQKEKEQQQKAIEKAKEDKRQQSIANNTQKKASHKWLRPVSDTSEAFGEILKDYNAFLYKEAFNALKPLAESGNTSAQYVTGVMYENGYGVTKDADRAMFWIEKSAKGGETAAQIEYSNKILSSPLTDAEYKIAFDYLEPLAKQDNVEAMETYINGCLNLKGTPKHVNTAIKYCERLVTLKNDSNYNISKESLKRIKNQWKSKSSSFSLNFNVSKFIKVVVVIAVLVIAFRFARSFIGTKLAEMANSSNEEVTEVAQEQVQILEVTVGECNVRTGPGTEYDVITTATQSQTFTVIGEGSTSDGTPWYQVTLADGSEGWISSKVATTYYN